MGPEFQGSRYPTERAATDGLLRHLINTNVRKHGYLLNNFITQFENAENANIRDTFLTEEPFALVIPVIVPQSHYCLG